MTASSRDEEQAVEVAPTDDEVGLRRVVVLCRSTDGSDQDPNGQHRRRGHFRRMRLRDTRCEHRVFATSIAEDDVLGVDGFVVPREIGNVCRISAERPPERREASNGFSCAKLG